MTDRHRRHPQRPRAFWAVFAAVAVVGLGVAAGVGLMAHDARPIQVAQ